MPSENTQQPEISRQARWQRKRVAAGLCSICGRPRGKGSNAVRCGKCVRKERQRYQRKVAA